MWHFWLDVGGTFTDCLARSPDGTLLRRKVLSSAITKGQAAIIPLPLGEGGRSPSGGLQDATTFQLHDPSRTEPTNFWTNYTLRLLDNHGNTLLETLITESTPSGHLTIAATPANLQFAISNLQFPLSPNVPVSPSPPYAYELLAPEEAPLLAIRLFLGLRLHEPIPPCSIRLGTTRGTNALLTRRGAKTAFITTRGFADILRIGYQNRAQIFELAIKKPQPLFTAIAEIDERIAADGSVLQAPSESQINQELVRLKAAGIESLAICLLNSYANPSHEQQIEKIARAAGFSEISVSHRVSPLMKIVPRGDTTVVDAYLNPILKTYIERLATALTNPSDNLQFAISHLQSHDSNPQSASIPHSALRTPHSDSTLRLMTSAGGLASSHAFTGKDSLLSGPAGGVVGFSKAAEAAGFRNAIGFDMGGTSTDVSRYDGRYEYEFETEKAGVRIVAPMLAIETVAAGGGSICRFDGVKLVVGPESAGADPGPACYGRGGPLTITDCNLLLGRIVESQFPFPLDRAAAKARIAEIADLLVASRLPFMTHTALAAGFVRIANANMAQAIRSISIAKGYDPRRYVLVGFGAAGPQHACAVAAELGIRSVLIHPDAGVLSALGIGLADVIKERAVGVYGLLNEKAGELEKIFEELEAQVRRDVIGEGIAAENISVARWLELRYTGTDATLQLSVHGDRELAGAFQAKHLRRYGYTHPHRPLEVVTARVRAVGRCAMNLSRSELADAKSADSPQGSQAAFIDGQACQLPIFDRSVLKPGTEIAGPAIIVEPLTTTIVDPGWVACVYTGGELVLHGSAEQADTGDSTAVDPVLLELFNNHFTAIATQMGITLRNTSMSVNVKERLDFSCAIFTPEGDLVVNAPHIPVHLGAMSQTVKQIIADNPHMRPGYAFVTNDPYRGGSHLPDVTVITPVFADSASSNPQSEVRNPQSESDQPPAPSPQLLFFTASRAHHAEIGGITPGSMPPFSTKLAEEGVVISNFKIIDRGESRLDELRTLLLSGPYPSRSVDANLADITAQMAANIQGAEDLRRLIGSWSLPVVQAYMQHIQAAAEQKTRAALSKLPPGRREFTDRLDDGTPIHVSITIHKDEEPITVQEGERGRGGEGAKVDSPTRPLPHSPAPLSALFRIPHSALRTLPSATIDFTGSGPIHPGNLNANPSIVTAAVIYVLRLLINEAIPLNQGVLNAVELIIPPGSILNPISNLQFAVPNLQSPAPNPQSAIRNPRSSDTPHSALRVPHLLPAVVGGNVETSQRIVDVLLGALGLAAASQGTMNNLLFGDETFGYYETICGGSGATVDADGADAVHTHMTNTRLTDPEVLEARYPVRLHEFSIRRGSGGAGQHRGGNGIIRRLEFLKPLTLSILSQRRGPYPPYGLNGGAPGALGHNSIQRSSTAPVPVNSQFAIPNLQPSAATPHSAFRIPYSPNADPLAALVQTTVHPGDQLIIETPGGGGCGSPTPDS